MSVSFKYSRAHDIVAAASDDKDTLFSVSTNVKRYDNEQRLS
jgi:hypothetical protein